MARELKRGCEGGGLSREANSLICLAAWRFIGISGSVFVSILFFGVASNRLGDLYGFCAICWVF